MGAQVYSVPGQTEGRSKAFFGTENHRLIPRTISYMWGYVNYYKSVDKPIPTHGNREQPGNFQSRPVNSAFSEFFHFIL